MPQSPHPPSLLESAPRRRVFAPGWLPPLIAPAAAGVAYALADDPVLRLLVPFAVALGAYVLGAALARLLPRARWRVTELGLHRLRGTRNVATHLSTPAQPLVLTVPDLVVRMPLDYGASAIGSLSATGATGLRMSPFPFHLAFRRIGLPLRLADGKGAAPGLAAHWEAGFARREAALLAAAAEGPLPSPAADTVEWARPEPEERRRQFTGRLVPLLMGLVALGVAAVPSDGAVPGRVAVINALAVLVLVWTAGSYWRVLRNPGVRWSVGPRGITAYDPWFGTTELPADRIAAIVPQRATEETPTGTTRTSVVLQFYGYDLSLLGTAHAGRIPPVELLAVLRSRGYRVIEDENAPDGGAHRAPGQPPAPEYDAYATTAYASLPAGAAHPAPARPAPQGPPPPPSPAGGEPVVVPLPAATRLWYYLGGVASGAVVAAILGFKLRHLVGGGMSWLVWGLPAGMAIGALAGWFHDLRRPGVVLGPDGIRLAGRGGKGGTQWGHDRATIGGIAVEAYDNGERALYVWSPSGQVIRKDSGHLPDAQELRRGCERAGLPWGRPDFGHWSPPPPTP